ncbi:uncharacterized protein C16orf46 homolog [Brachyhypopomus gauderio]|uniref:uncharacterized protein C16orf46 homolog n=1 Tax=Brachyhypopomus gauderio TaxID=698409 RepID=UPI0040415EE7
MNSPTLCVQPVDVDTNVTLENPQQDEQFFKTFDRECVNVLLDFSEDQSLVEEDVYESQPQTGWEGAIQGWGLSPPLACLFQAQKKGSKITPDVIDSHCILCADLKDLKQTEILVPECSRTSAKHFCEPADEPLKNTVSTIVERLKRAPSSTSFSCSSGEEQERNIKGDELLFEGELCRNSQTLPHHPQHNMQGTFMKERGEEKSPVIVLPPVKASTPAKPKSHSLLKRREAPDMCQAEGETDRVPVCGTSGPVVFGEKEDVAGKPVSPYSNSTLDACQGSLTSKQRLDQHQCHMLSALTTTFSKRQQPFSTLADQVARATSLLGRDLKQDRLTRSPLRHNSGHRLHYGFRSKNVRRPEAELPVLLGTRVPIPVSTHRLL